MPSKARPKIFFEHFITKDLNIAPKKYKKVHLMGKALPDKKKEDKEDILPKKEKKRRKSQKRRKKEELDTLKFISILNSIAFHLNITFRRVFLRPPLHGRF